MEKEERFSHFRSRLMGSLIMTLGAMAAEHVFYGENTEGVAGDVQSATNTAALMVGWCAMGPEPVHLHGSQDVEADTREVLDRLARIGTTIMSRARVSNPMAPDPVGAVLGDRDKRHGAAQLLGQAYVSAYSLINANREGVERIAQLLIERKELYGDEVTELLSSVGLRRPEIDLLDDRTWPEV
jgi:ATP-dependent Zn protease